MSTACAHAIRLLTFSEMDVRFWLRANRLVGGFCAVVGCDRRPAYFQTFRFLRNEKWVLVRYRPLCFEHGRRVCVTYSLELPLRFDGVRDLL